MTTVRIQAGEFSVTVKGNVNAYPDALDEMCKRASALFLEVQAGLPEADEPEA